MKDYDVAIFLSVFYEMLGPVLWVLAIVAAVVAVGFIAVVARDRKVSGRRFLRAEVIGVVGGIAAVLLMQAITHSSFGDIGGPIDLLLVVSIWLAGAVGTTLVAYLAQSLRSEPSAKGGSRASDQSPFVGSIAAGLTRSSNEPTRSV